MSTPAWLPSSGLIREHHDYCVWATDAPPIYHVAAMATAMASLCADRAQLVVDNHPYPLHLWSMMIGRSTVDRKTTSTRMAVQRVERSLGGQSRVKRIYGSPEGILQGLKQDPCIVLYVPEGGAFFAQREAGYWKHARDIFMDLYDYTEVFERTLVKEKVRIEDPRISILSACAFPLLDRYTRDTDWLGGFLARFLLVAGEPQPFKDRPQSDPDREARIEELLRRVYLATWGSMGVSVGARRVLDDFAGEIHACVDEFAPGLGPSLNRLPETAHRLAALYEISAQAENPPGENKFILVTPESARCAVALCRASRDAALSQIGELTVSGAVARDMAKVEGIIRRSGVVGVRRSTLLRATRMTARDLDRLLKTLEEQELIVYGVGSSTGGRPAVLYQHVEAKKDAERQAATNIATPPAYVDLTRGIVNLDGLPAASEPSPWDLIADSHDDDDEHGPN